MMNKLQLPLLGLAIFSIMISVVYFVHKEKQQCDQVVFIEGELSMDAREVSCFPNGMSCIRLCDGTNLQIPTHRIIKIVEKE